MNTMDEYFVEKYQKIRVSQLINVVDESISDPSRIYQQVPLSAIEPKKLTVYLDKTFNHEGAGSISSTGGVCYIDAQETGKYEVPYPLYRLNMSCNQLTHKSNSYSLVPNSDLKLLNFGVTTYTESGNPDQPVIYGWPNMLNNKSLFGADLYFKFSTGNIYIPETTAAAEIYDVEVHKVLKFPRPIITF
tara:strand:- start:327 stop:893 length:567 start_codon:yes stop_codon:yes gene_type:complete